MEGDMSELSSVALSPNISIHSLRMEGDVLYGYGVHPESIFQSTPSAWRETLFSFFAVIIDGISIHSLRMEGDLLLLRRYNSL